MKVKMLMGWSKYKAGEVVECSDADGCHMVNTGVASVVEQTKITDEERELTRAKQDPKDHPAPKEE